MSKPGELRVSVGFHSIITSGNRWSEKHEREKEIYNNMFRHSFRRENRGGADAMSSLGAGKRSGPPPLYDLSTSFGTFPRVYHHGRSLNLQHTPRRIPAAVVSFGFSIYHSTSVHYT